MSFAVQLTDNMERGLEVVGGARTPQQKADEVTKALATYFYLKEKLGRDPDLQLRITDKEGKTVKIVELPT